MIGTSKVVAVLFGLSLFGKIKTDSGALLPSIVLIFRVTFLRSGASTFSVVKSAWPGLSLILFYLQTLSLIETMSTL